MTKLRMSVILTLIITPIRTFTMWVLWGWFAPRVGLPLLSPATLYLAALALSYFIGRENIQSKEYSAETEGELYLEAALGILWNAFTYLLLGFILHLFL